MAKLELWHFDSTEFDTRIASSWIVPGSQGTRGRGQRTLTGQWAPCKAIAYNPDAETFLVVWDASNDQSEVRCESCRGELGSPTNDGLRWQLRRLQICFDAEDPVYFVERVCDAYKRRLRVASTIRYNLYVDCMPLEDSPEPCEDQLDAVLSLAINTTRLRRFAIDTTVLVRDIKIDYARTMNKLVFDNQLAERAQDSDDSLSVLGAVVPSRSAVPTGNGGAAVAGTVTVPDYDFPLAFNHFSFHSFFTQPQVIKAAVRCAMECAKVQEV